MARAELLSTVLLFVGWGIKVLLLSHAEYWPGRGSWLLLTLAPFGRKLAWLPLPYPEVILSELGAPCARVDYIETPICWELPV